MALNLPYGVKPLNPSSNIDERYGPHNTIQEALDATAGTRELGTTVGIVENNSIVEYWFKEGILDEHLVIKIAGYTSEPDGIVQKGSVVINASSVDLDENWKWRYDSVVYQKLTPTNIPIPVPLAGNFRLDWIVGDTNNNIILIQGAESSDSSSVIAPVVPDGNIPLVQVFSNEAGIDYTEDQALSSFVRFDVNNQNLTSLQRLNARTNIQAVSKDTSDERTVLPNTSTFVIGVTKIHPLQNVTISGSQ